VKNGAIFLGLAALTGAAVFMGPTPERVDEALEVEPDPRGSVHIIIDDVTEDGVLLARIPEHGESTEGLQPMLRLRSRDGYAEHGYMQGPWSIVEGSHGKTVLQTWTVDMGGGRTMRMDLQGIGTRKPLPSEH